MRPDLQARLLRVANAIEKLPKVVVDDAMYSDFQENGWPRAGEKRRLEKIRKALRSWFEQNFQSKFNKWPWMLGVSGTLSHTGEAPSINVTLPTNIDRALIPDLISDICTKFNLEHSSTQVHPNRTIWLAFTLPLAKKTNKKTKTTR